MTQDRWTRIKDILGTALELETDARSLYVADVCGSDAALREEVETLLASSDEADDFIEKPALADADFEDEDLPRDPPDALIGTRVGPYRILQLIGEGGMGVVYRAIRDEGDFPLHVAIKVVKRGMDTHSILRRFREERRILSRLDHGNIAKLLDGGITTDGRPYFVMELLEGTPIHIYARANGLSVNERLQLFLQACDAVEYSHRNLVVHRDLKASNILVSVSGVPKLLDFGIAKLMDRDTSTAGNSTRAERLMTPDYASPEQVRGEAITTATDVYSLGVLLYELLTEQRPFDLLGLPHHEMARVLATTDPEAPSCVAPKHLAREIPADLDTIVLKAMHRSVERRYASVQQFAQDIRRYLTGLPVFARPDSWSYRATKFLGRHRAAVIFAAISLVVIFGSSLAVAWERGVALSKQQEARKRFGDLRELANALLGELDGELEKLPGSTPAREILANKVLRYLDVLAKDEIGDRTLQRELAIAYERLGDVQGGPKGSNLGNTAGALESYRKALSIFQNLVTSSPSDLHSSRDLARMHSKVSDIFSMTGEYKDALEYELRALEVRENWFNAHPNDRQAKRALAASLQELAVDLDRLGESQRVLEVRNRALTLLDELVMSGPADTNLYLALALAQKRMGRSLHREKRFKDAIPYFDQALEVEGRQVQADPVNATARVNLSFTHHDKGLSLAAMGDHNGALKSFGEAFRLRSELAAADPKDVRSASLLASTYLHRGLSLLHSGQVNLGIEDIRKSLNMRENLANRDPKNKGARTEVAEAQASYADAWRVMGKAANALEWYRRAAATYAALGAPEDLAAEYRGEPLRIRAAIETLQRF